jgi:phage host-nuclease inhibitor protein Gam
MAKKTGCPKRKVVGSPQNLAEAAQSLTDIGAVKRRIEELNRALNEEIERAKSEAAKKAVPLAEKRQQLFEGLYVFAGRHRAELTQDGKTRTVSVVSGDFGWRTTPPAVSIRNAEKVLAELHSKGLTAFIRTKEEINKEAMLANQEDALQVPGVKIGQHEEFFAKPSEVDAEMSAPSERLKKTVE